MCMTEKATILISVLAIVFLGAIAMVGTIQTTGAVIQTTSNPGRLTCMCIITQYDFNGNPINVIEQMVRASSRQAHTDAGCNNRCDIMHGKSKRGRKHVTGVAI